MSFNFLICQMGINEGCSACHKAQTGIMKTAPERGSESILENKCANKYPLLLVIFERGEQNHVAAEGLSLSSALWISVLLRIRHKNLMRVMAICSRAQHCAWHHWKTQMKYNSKDLGSKQWNPPRAFKVLCSHSLIPLWEKLKPGAGYMLTQDDPTW